MRFLLFAKLYDERYYLLQFDDFEVYECLFKVPNPEGLWAISKWPIYEEKQITFFVEYITGNVKSFFILDRKINKKDYIIVEPMQ